MGAAVHIPAALHQDTKELERPRSLLVLPAALFPLLVLVSPFVTGGDIFELHWTWWLGGFLVALLWAIGADVLARSPKPWKSAMRLLGWGALWCLEPLAVLFLLGPLAAAHEIAAVVIGVLYLGGALAFGFAIFRHYWSKR